MRQVYRNKTLVPLILVVLASVWTANARAAATAILKVSDKFEHIWLQNRSTSDVDISFLEFEFGPPQIGSPVSTFRFFSNVDEYKNVVGDETEDFPFASKARKIYADFRPGLDDQDSINVYRIVSLDPFDAELSGLVSMENASATVGFSDGTVLTQSLPNLDLGDPPSSNTIPSIPGAICVCIQWVSIPPIEYSLHESIIFSTAPASIPLPPTAWLFCGAAVVGLLARRRNRSG